MQTNDYQPLDRYRQLAEKSPDFISRHTPGDLVFIDVNPAVEKILGYRSDEIIGRSANELFHPKDVGSWKNGTSNVTYSEGVYTSTYRLRHKNGDYIWLETTSRTIRDPETGELEEIICVSRDVSERIQADRTLSRLAQVVEATSDLVLFCNANYQVVYLNESAIRTLNIDKGRFPTLHLDELFSRDNNSRLLQEIFPQALETGEWRGELPLEPGSIEDRIASVHQIIAHRNEEQELRYFSIIGRDITEQRRAEAEALQYQLNMAHISRLMSLGEMASGLAHEINQPLGAILNYSRGTLRRIQEGTIKDFDKVCESLQLISRQAIRAADIIKRLRGFVKKTEYQRMDFSINETCLEIAQFMGQEARNEGIRFDFQLDPAEPVIYADKVQIEQVILNLLRNAIEAFDGSRDNGEKTITIATRMDAEQLLVEVEDNASGITADQMSNLFEPYFTSKSAGLGMGLSISRTIIEAHRGKLWAESDGRTGSTFKISLPKETLHP
ncbi:PAS domain-containing sensor histidine kinase [Motiliproteus sp.]|uniref:PAS domain-containing sensor histidine kinase n=1 Tax=Motiliproteus sp. TaxID=1898955 RepID=UPI003BA9C1F0